MTNQELVAAVVAENRERSAEQDARIRALAKHLGLDNDGIDDLSVSRYDDASIEYGREEYLVLTDDEADDRAREDMKQSLWAFNVDFLARYTSAFDSSRTRRAWEKMVGELCEDATPLVEALLGDQLEKALSDALREDGRGHFIARYDSEEYDETIDGETFYIYRVN